MKHRDSPESLIGANSNQFHAELFQVVVDGSARDSLELIVDALEERHHRVAVPLVRSPLQKSVQPSQVVQDHQRPYVLHTQLTIDTPTNPDFRKYRATGNQLTDNCSPDVDVGRETRVCNQLTPSKDSVLSDVGLQRGISNEDPVGRGRIAVDLSKRANESARRDLDLRS